MTYCSVEDVRRVYEPDQDAPDSVYQSAIDAAVGQIDEFCGRSFGQTVGDVREFPAELDFLGAGRRAAMDIDDVVPVDSPAAMTDVRVETKVDPSDGDEGWEVQDSGWWFGPRTPKDGWPYTELVVFSPGVWSGRFVRVTADWGWPTVPPQVQRACLMSSARIMLREQSILGVQSSGEFGTVQSFPRPDPDTARMLRPFKKSFLLSKWD